MGCGASKENSNPDEIKSDMKHTKVAQFDEFFRTARDVLDGLEELRGGFQETRETMNDIGRTDELVEPKFGEALRVFFWSVSAHSKGEIIKSGLRFDTDPPAFTIDCGNMHYTTWEFSDALMKLIGGFTGAPGKILEITQKVKEISEQAAELSKDIKGTVQGAGLTGLDEVRAIANAGINFKTVTVGVSKAPKVLKEAQEALNDIKEVLPQFKELIGKADEVGKKAHEKHIDRINEIFDHFQTAPKKTPEQIKADQKDKKKAPRKVKKPQQSKPTEHKPADHKPVEHKSEHKPEEHKPEEHKPEEHKPEEHKPAEHKPEEHKPIEA